MRLGTSHRRNRMLMESQQLKMGWNSTSTPLCWYREHRMSAVYDVCVSARSSGRKAFQAYRSQDSGTNDCIDQRCGGFVGRATGNKRQAFHGCWRANEYQWVCFHRHANLNSFSRNRSKSNRIQETTNAAKVNHVPLLHIGLPHPLGDDNAVSADAMGYQLPAAASRGR